jgi:hypothetical protein
VDDRITINVDVSGYEDAMDQFRAAMQNIREAMAAGEVLEEMNEFIRLISGGAPRYRSGAARARELLYSVLTLEQQRSMETGNRFKTVALSGADYTIEESNTYGLSRCVTCKKKYGMRTIAHLCVRPKRDPDSPMPLLDSMYQIKMLLESIGGEDALIAAANITLRAMPSCGDETCVSEWEAYRNKLRKTHYKDEEEDEMYWQQGTIHLKPLPRGPLGLFYKTTKGF